jgi:hypothetical protein
LAAVPGLAIITGLRLAAAKMVVAVAVGYWQERKPLAGLAWTVRVLPVAQGRAGLVGAVVAVALSVPTVQLIRAVLAARVARRRSLERIHLLHIPLELSPGVVVVVALVLRLLAPVVLAVEPMEKPRPKATARRSTLGVVVVAAFQVERLTVHKAVQDSWQ